MEGGGCPECGGTGRVGVPLRRGGVLLTACPGCGGTGRPTPAALPRLGDGPAGRRLALRLGLRLVFGGAGLIAAGLVFSFASGEVAQAAGLPSHPVAVGAVGGGGVAVVAGLLVAPFALGRRVGLLVGGTGLAALVGAAGYGVFELLVWTYS